MEQRDIRTAMLIGHAALEKLKNSRVAVFGVGGVGGYVVEALVRAGVGAIDLIDNDTISESNINRQLIATYAVLGRYKTDAFEERIKLINPLCRVKKHTVFFNSKTESLFNFGDYSYVVDAIDSVSGKIALAEACEAAKTPIISSMGTGNKLDPTAFEISDIYKTSVCPLARVMRTELKKRGVKALKVLYSKEMPRKPLEYEVGTSSESSAKRATPASISFVPSAAGLIIASEVIRDLTNGLIPS